MSKESDILALRARKVRTLTTILHNIVLTSKTFVQTLKKRFRVFNFLYQCFLGLLKRRTHRSKRFRSLTFLLLLCLSLDQSTFRSEKFISYTQILAQRLIVHENTILYFHTESLLKCLSHLLDTLLLLSSFLLFSFRPSFFLYLWPLKAGRVWPTEEVRKSTSPHTATRMTAVRPRMQAL